MARYDHYLSNTANDTCGKLEEWSYSHGGVRATDGGMLAWIQERSQTRSPRLDLYQRCFWNGKVIINQEIKPLLKLEYKSQLQFFIKKYKKLKSLVFSLLIRMGRWEKNQPILVSIGSLDQNQGNPVWGEKVNQLIHSLAPTYPVDVVRGRCSLTSRTQPTWCSTGGFLLCRVFLFSPFSGRSVSFVTA